MISIKKSKDKTRVILKEEFKFSEHVCDLIFAILNVKEEYMFYNVTKVGRRNRKKIIEQIERAFAYELYHQWSLLKEKTLILNGEIDKDIEKKRYYPDMVLHGGQCDYDNNKIVVEIKRGKAIDSSKIIKDLEKLSPYLEKKKVKWANYENAVFILYDADMGIISKALDEEKNEKIFIEDDIICITYNYDNNVYTLELARISDLRNKKNENLQAQTKIIGELKKITSDCDNVIDRCQKENAALKKQE